MRSSIDGMWLEKRAFKHWTLGYSKLLFGGKMKESAKEAEKCWWEKRKTNKAESGTPRDKKISRRREWSTTSNSATRSGKMPTENWSSNVDVIGDLEDSGLGEILRQSLGWNDMEKRNWRKKLWEVFSKGQSSGAAAGQEEVEVFVVFLRQKK